MIPLTLSLSAEFGTGPVEAHFSIALGKSQPDSLNDIALDCVKSEGEDILHQLAQPEIDHIKQSIFDWYNTEGHT